MGWQIAEWADLVHYDPNHFISTRNEFLNLKFCWNYFIHNTILMFLSFLFCAQLRQIISLPNLRSLAHMIACAELRTFPR
jgi:hypothetical protein